MHHCPHFYMQRWSVVGRQEQSVSILPSVLHSTCHFLITVCLWRWGGNSCVNTAVAMETAGFPWPHSPLGDPVCGRRGGIETFQELSMIHSSAYYLAIELSWLMCDVNKSYLCHGPRVNLLQLGALRRGGDARPVHFSGVHLCLFRLTGRRAHSDCVWG